MVCGTATDPRIADGVSRDRNLPVLSGSVPLPGEPMVLHSKSQSTVYIVGQSQEDADAAMQAYAAWAGMARPVEP